LLDSLNLAQQIGLSTVACTSALFLARLFHDERVHLELDTMQAILLQLLIAKPSYMAASQIMLSMIFNAPMLTRNPSVSAEYEDKTFLLPLSRVIQPTPVSDDPTDIKIFTEMSFRDYLRGLLRLGKWQKAVQEYSMAHNAARYIKPRKAVLVPQPMTAQELGIRFLHGVNEDNLSVVLQEFGMDPQYFTLDVSSIVLFRLHGALTFGASKVFLNAESIWEELWSASLGARIQHGMDARGQPVDRYNGMSIHDIAQKLSITTLLVIPHGILSALPLPAARRQGGDHYRYAIEDYTIEYFGPWIARHVEHMTPARHRRYMLIADPSPEESKLPYAQAEVTCLAHLVPVPTIIMKSGGWVNPDEIPSSNGDPLSQLLDLASDAIGLHFSCHGTLFLGDDLANSIVLHLGAGVRLTINPETLFDLRLRPDASVFLNCCNSSAASPGSLEESYTLPTYFLAAGAQSVISTTSDVRDLDAFRLAMRVQELTSNGHSQSQALRATCLEALSGSLPDYAEYLRLRGFGTLAKEASYRTKRGLDDVISWKYYIVWRQHSHDRNE
jgi:hypothetical protein